MCHFSGQGKDIKQDDLSEEFIIQRFPLLYIAPFPVEWKIDRLFKFCTSAAPVLSPVPKVYPRVPHSTCCPVALELLQYKVASKIPYGYFQSSLNLSAPHLSLYDTAFICESDNKGTFKLHISTHTKRDLHWRDLHCPFMTLTNEKCLNKFAKSKYCAVILSAS